MGYAGVKGFGWTSWEAEIANAKLAAFSARAKIAAAATIRIAMIRSELGAINAQANFAQSPGTTTRTVQVLTFAGDLAEVSMDKIATPEKN